MTSQEATHAEIEKLKTKMEASTDADERTVIAEQMEDLRASLKRSEQSKVVELFPGSEKLLPFPVEVFDEDTRKLVELVAQSTENPIDAVAFVAFNMPMATYGAYVQVKRKDGYVKWCCDYAYLTGASSAGKTPIYEMLQQGIHETEKRLREDALERVRDAHATIARLEEDKRLLKRKYKGTSPDVFEAELRDMQERIDELKTITMPELLLHDVSPEAMLVTQSENDDTAAMVSAELPILSRLLGRATGKPPDIDALLSSYDGEFYRVKRISRDKNWIDEARLSILGGTQLSVIEDMGQRPELWDRGLVNRFWFGVAPDVTDDDLQDEEVEVPDKVLRPYREKLVKLGLHFRNNYPVEPYVLSAEADRVFTGWRNRFKRLHRLPGTKHHHMTGFCRKLEDKVLRWATNLHVFADHTTAEVSVEAMRNALKVQRYALSHFQYIYALTHGSQTSSIERSLRRHLARKKGKEITVRNIKNGLPSFSKAAPEVQTEALENLQDDGFLQIKEVKQAGGGRPSLRVVVL